MLPLHTNHGVIVIPLRLRRSGGATWLRTLFVTGKRVAALTLRKLAVPLGTGQSRQRGAIGIEPTIEHWIGVSSTHTICDKAIPDCSVTLLQSGLTF